VASDLDQIRLRYKAVKECCQLNWISSDARNAIRNLAKWSLKFLETKCLPVRLNSRVPGKEFQAYKRKNGPLVVSRPANQELFVCNSKRVDAMWGEWGQQSLSVREIPQFLYTVALSPCLAMELFDRQNKKGPATYFECFVGHLFASASGAEPRKRAALPVEGRTVRLTMDFIFDRQHRPSIHMAVKMSTRERVVQAWAHQRLLDSAFGVGSYRGFMVLFGETKLDSRSHEVVEICVPDQWLAYQALLSKMDRIYYFDPPERYAQLAADHPNLVKLKRFADFFSETEAVLGA